MPLGVLFTTRIEYAAILISYADFEHRLKNIPYDGIEQKND